MVEKIKYHMSTEERKDHSCGQRQDRLQGVVGDILAGLRMSKVWEAEARWQEQEWIGAQGGFLAEGGVYGQGQEHCLAEE